MSKKIGGLPRHIAFIMDGNGRWAEKRSLPRHFGHRYGAAALKKIVKYCNEIGVEYISFFAFSTENWKRPAVEVAELMKLFGEYLDEIESLTKNNSRLIFLGDKSAFSEDLRTKMEKAEKSTAENSEMTVMIAVNYGGRDEIVHAAKEIAKLHAENFLKLDDLNEELFSNFMYTKNCPDVDLLIRPSGELRLSNFFLWQIAYAEFYFTDCLWPDFGKKELDDALKAYNLRKRRFGGI